uniref:Uncharacterized protein n=1 Tax=Arundo donax TaxID=35708 RepID=A0A0A9HCH8_ARUDO
MARATRLFGYSSRWSVRSRSPMQSHLLPCSELARTEVLSTKA